MRRQRGLSKGRIAELLQTAGIVRRANRLQGPAEKPCDRSKAGLSSAGSPIEGTG